MRKRQLVALLFVMLLLVGQVLMPAATMAQSVVRIFDIQYTIDPSGDSPYLGQTVTTVGVVSMFDSYGYVIQDRQGGHWNGLYIYDTTYMPSLGDEVEITGDVDEYYGFTELTNLSSLNILSTDNGIPTTEVTCTAAMTESVESVLVAIYASVVTSDSLGFGEWEISDASGSARVGDSVFAFTPTMGMTMTLVRGGVWYSYGNFKIEPDDDLDVLEADAFRLYDVQYPGGDSPYLGQVVTVTGIVVALDSYGYVLEDASGGPWSGVYVYDDVHTPDEGDNVLLTGEVDEYYSFTEIVNVAVYTVTSSGNPLPTPEGVPNEWIGTGTPRAESYESVLVSTDRVTVTSDTLGFGEWEITDRMVLPARVGDHMYTYVPVMGEVLHTVRGILWYSYSDFKIEPRYMEDLISLDTTPPNITFTEPAPGVTDTNPYLPIKAVFDSDDVDPTTINAATFLLEDASGPLSGRIYYDTDSWTAVLDPDETLAPGTTYTATVTGAVADFNGNDMGVDYVWTFATAAATLQPYLGSIHNHTSYSDGVQDPDAAFTAAQARDLAFFAITDHSHMINDTEWEDTMAQAISHTVDSSFIALAGWEYTNSTEGHLNGFNTIRRPVRTDRGYGYADYCETMADFYDWIVQHPEAEGHFNHPAWMNFNDWDYRIDAEPMMQMLEVGNGAYSYYVWTEEEYQKALDYGWRVGPTNNGDTHDDQWGIDNPGRTGIWASELTQDGVIEAMDAMRIFATEDSNWLLYLMGDGAWMGQTIPNDGTIDFEIYVNDPDGENTASLALVTNQGVVVTSTVPTSNPYTWTFSLDISEGVHYFYVRAEQEDGDRALSAPIWTAGDVDVAPTALTITPARLTTLTPAIFEARVTNRGIAAAPNVVVTFRVDTTVISSDTITVPVGADAFASVDWTPDVTGTVDISAEITDVPAGDNPDDNTITVQREIVDYLVPLIVIDNGHSNNVFVSGSADDFKQDLVDYGFNWVEDTDGFTTTDLVNAVLLIISDPGENGDDIYTPAEEQVIADFVNNGGALLFAGDSDYHDHGNPDEVNAILEQIDGARIRMNRDGAYDPTDSGNPTWPWNVLWHNLPAWETTGIGANVDIVVGFSGCSIYGVDEFGTPIALTTGNGITVTVFGDDDTYQNDDGGDGFYYTYTAPYTIPMAAVQELPGGGRIAVWGDSSESFSDAFTYVQGDGYQNEIYNMESIYWLLGHPLQQSTIAEARYDAEWNDTPDHIDKLVWLEGTLTAGRDYFYETLYLQDDTGGIAIYTLDPEYLLTDTLSAGVQVRVVGRLELRDGETNVLVAWDMEQNQILTTGVVPAPLMLTTTAAAMEQNEGWLVQTFGRVVAVIDEYNLIIDDGSGPARVNIDRYNGDFAGVTVGDFVDVIGLASEDADGQRIRVRQLDDVTITPGYVYYIPIVFKTYLP